jgi:two-component system NarL family response regulator
MIVDDHQLFLEGLGYLLETYKIEVVGKAKNGSEAITKARILKPDIILMDIIMPEMNGLDALKLIKSEMPDIKILMLTTSDDDDDLFEAIKLGASGYLIKNTDGKDLISKLQQVENGEIPLSPGLASRILLELNKKYDNRGRNSRNKEKTCDHEKITNRQLEILEIVASGKTYKKTGELLGLSERTVKYHMGRIVEILHLENKTQVIAYAKEHSLIENIKIKPVSNKVISDRKG